MIHVCLQKLSFPLNQLKHSKSLQKYNNRYNKSDLKSAFLLSLLGWRGSGNVHVLACLVSKQVTCDQASLVFFFFLWEGTSDTVTRLFICRTLIKINKNICQRDCRRCHLDKNIPITITRSRVVGDNYNRLTTAMVVFFMALAVRPI